MNTEKQEIDQELLLSLKKAGITIYQDLQDEEIEENETTDEEY